MFSALYHMEDGDLFSLASTSSGCGLGCSVLLNVVSLARDVCYRLPWHGGAVAR